MFQYVSLIWSLVFLVARWPIELQCDTKMALKSSSAAQTITQQGLHILTIKGRRPYSKMLHPFKAILVFTAEIGIYVWFIVKVLPCFQNWNDAVNVGLTIIFVTTFLWRITSESTVSISWEFITKYLLVKPEFPLEFLITPFVGAHLSNIDICIWGRGWILIDRCYISCLILLIQQGRG